MTLKFILGLIIFIVIITGCGLINPKSYEPSIVIDSENTVYLFWIQDKINFQKNVVELHYTKITPDGKRTIKDKKNHIKGQYS